MRCLRHPVRDSQFLCRSIVLIKDVFLHLPDNILGLGIVVTVGRLSPERIFVQLEGIDSNAAAHHGAQPSVAQRQILLPEVSRTVIPQPVVAVEDGRRNRTGIACGETDTDAFGKDVSSQVADAACWQGQRIGSVQFEFFVGNRNLI